MINIEDFIQENKDILLEEHINELRKYQKYVECYALTDEEEANIASENHLKQCVNNSNAIDVTENCQCFFLNKFKREINKIVNLYSRLIK